MDSSFEMHDVLKKGNHVNFCAYRGSSSVIAFATYSKLMGMMTDNELIPSPISERSVKIIDVKIVTEDADSPDGYYSVNVQGVVK